MKKKDIKRGTIIVIAFSVVIFVVISLLCKIPEEEKIEEQIDEESHWSETLTNDSSQIEALRPMDAAIERFMQTWELKGLSLAVTRNDSLLYAKGYGWADREDSVKMEVNSVMRIASVSKLVTAVAIMKLIENGKLTLDSKVFGPEGILNDTIYTNAMRDPRMQDITIDHLLRHQGGFTLGAGDPMFNTKDIMEAKHLTTPPTNQELTKIVLGRRLGFTPGAGRKYSNFGYMLLSLVIERLTGQSYWDYVQQAVLHPAGAYNFRPATNYFAERSPNEVKYYAPDDELVEEFNGSHKMVTRVYGGSNFNALMGAGGWVTSAADLARLVAAIDKDPKVADVINAESVDCLTAYDPEKKENLSRGWAGVDEKGSWVRTGTLSSTHALVQHTPDGQCWVMITNSGVWTGSKFSKDMQRLMDRLRDTYSPLMPHRNLWH